MLHPLFRKATKVTSIGSVVRVIDLVVVPFCGILPKKMTNRLFFQILWFPSQKTF